MVNVRERGERIRRFIIDNVDENASDIARLTADEFQISRQAVNQHLQRLVNEGCLVQQGRTRSRSYTLAPLESLRERYPVSTALTEDRAWIEDVAPALSQLPDNVFHIWHYAFTEMFNNAIEHSEGSSIEILVERTAASTRIVITDDGVGIFRKIQAAMDLADERHAPLELAKGKFTTDPKRHSGEGIFFTSRMFDDFAILSGSVFFNHEFPRPEDWILETDLPRSGTVVMMKLSNHTARTTKKVFDRFSLGEDYGFTKTVVPVRLAKYGDDNLVSRSQARRLLSRFERFRKVVLDFHEVDTVGQAFADEVFRVWARMHPDVELVTVRTTAAVAQMIRRARAHEE